MTPPTPLAADRNLTQGMLDALGRAIVTGAFSLHPFPTEADLAKNYNVSRSVVREAVKMLTAKGLLRARPRQGIVVQPTADWRLFDPDVLNWLLDRKFSLTLLRQFTELRLAIEPAAASLAARTADAKGLNAIAVAYARMELAERGEDDALSADIAFHVAIVHATGNPFFLQFSDLIESALKTSIRFTNRYKGRTASLPDHRRVMDRIIDRDAEAAAAAMAYLIAEVIALVTQAAAQETDAEMEWPA